MVIAPLKKIKSMLALLVSTVLLLLLSSCSLLGSDVKSQLVPPQPQGANAGVVSALEAVAGKSITLLYPSAGKYKTPYVVFDDQKTALAFYTPESNSTNGTIALIKKQNDKWSVVKQIHSGYSRIKSIDFADVTNNANVELIVTYAGSRSDQLMVYSLFDDSLNTIVNKSCLFYSVLDLEGAGYNQILTISKNENASYNVASLYKYFDKTSHSYVASDKNEIVQDDSTVLLSQCSIDGDVSNYTSSITGQVAVGQKGIYISASKSNYSITELLYINNKKLFDPFCDNKAVSNTQTVNAGNQACKTISNDDATIVIPTTALMPLSNTNPNYLTQWRSFNGENFVNDTYVYYDYTYNYSFDYQDSWVDNGMINVSVQSVSQNPESINTNVFYVFNNVTGANVVKLFEICVFSYAEWQNVNQKQYFQLSPDNSNNTQIYAAKIDTSDYSFSLTENEIKASFKFIS